MRMFPAGDVWSGLVWNAGQLESSVAVYLGWPVAIVSGVGLGLLK